VHVDATHDGERGLLLAANFSRCVCSQILQTVYVNVTCWKKTDSYYQVLQNAKMFLSQVLKIAQVNITWWNKTASRYQFLQTTERRQLQVPRNVYVNVTHSYFQVLKIV
jgi:hypothetical protein